MNKSGWKRKIKQLMNKASTWQPFYDATVDTLADILEKRDLSLEQYEAEGSQILIEKSTAKGDIVMVRNPLLDTWIKLNDQAKSLFNDLGLTPAGLKRINDAASKTEGHSELEKALEAALNG